MRPSRPLGRSPLRVAPFAPGGDVFAGVGSYSQRAPGEWERRRAPAPATVRATLDPPPRCPRIDEASAA